MSQAHRPTWNPKVGRETKSGSQQVSKLALAAHTKLKFRQPGQTSRNDLAVRDLRAELLAAERAAVDKKRKAAGLPPLPVNSSSLRLENGDRSFSGENNGEDDKEGENEVIKRRRILEEVGDLDKDDEEDEVDGGVGGTSGKLDGDKGKGKAATVDEGEDDDEDESDDDSDSDDDDDTAALMAELAKIKQERAEEKARLDAEASASASIDREKEIALGNPLLNLASALGATTPGTPSSTTTSSNLPSSSTFAVKRRWDDDLIFKNQSAGVDDKPKKGEFVNDLLRSEFHKKFMLKFIK